VVGPTSSFNYSIAGFPNTTGKHLLFQMQQPSSFWLAIWNDAAVWNPMTQSDVQNTPYTVTVQLGKNTFTHGNFTVYNPYSTVISGSPAAAQNSSGVTQVSFTANDYLMLVQVQPTNYSSFASSIAVSGFWVILVAALIFLL